MIFRPSASSLSQSNAFIGVVLHSLRIGFTKPRLIESIPEEGPKHLTRSQ
jgi:hypothetical protein